MANSSSPLVECANYTRGGGPAAPDHDATHGARLSRVKEEQQRLVRWAEENRRLKSAERRLPEFARGGEHAVFYRHALKRYFKATLQERQKGYGIALGSETRGATPSEYLDRLALQNSIFQDDIRLEYVYVDQIPVIVTSQPAIRGNPPPQAAIDAMMVARGYEKLAEGAYYDESKGLLIFDLVPRNAFLTVDDRILPIDPVIQRIDGDFGEFLRQEPYTINLQ